MFMFFVPLNAAILGNSKRKRYLLEGDVFKVFVVWVDLPDTHFLHFIQRFLSSVLLQVVYQAFYSCICVLVEYL